MNMNINHEYRRCKRNFALCKRMDKRRGRKEKSQSTKAIRKVNRTYKRCLHDYIKTKKREERTKRRIYKGKIKWCKKHFGESIEYCQLSETRLEELGVPTVLNIILIAIQILFLPFTVLFFGIFECITTSDQYIHRHNIVK